MVALIVLALLALGPVILAFVFRVSPVLLFSSLLAGSLFVRYLGDDVSLTVAAFSRNPQAGLYAQAGLVILPLIITLVVARHSTSSSKLMLNILPLILVGLATPVVVLPQLPSDLQSQIFATEPGNLLRQFQDDIIGLMVLLNLGLIWWSFRKKPEHHGKHH